MAIEVAILLALLLYFFIFVSRDEIVKRNRKAKRLQYKKSWIHHKEKLPKYIP